MKKVTLILVLIVMTASSFTHLGVNDHGRIEAAEQLALSFVASLQESSATKYSELFPKLSEFQQIMKENQTVYGPFLKEAQQEFAITYEQKLLPAVRTSFEALIAEGKNKRIEWTHVKYVRVEADERIQDPLSAAPFTIVISSQGREYKVRIEKALFINGQWKVSQFIKLV